MSTLTPQQLATAIKANTTALAQYTAGNDTGCAATVSNDFTNNPKIVQPTFYTYEGLIAANYALTARLMTSIAAYVAANQADSILVGHIDECFRGHNVASAVPGVDIAQCGPLFTGLAGMLTTNGLTSADVTTLAGMCLVSNAVDVNEISAVRQGGLI